jgi:hypothetical protein
MIRHPRLQKDEQQEDAHQSERGFKDETVETIPVF